MLNLLNFEDSLSDNPRYRWQIEEHEAEISDLECCLEKVLKHCTGYVDTGKVFCDSMGPFIESVDELANHFNNDPEIKETFVCFTEHLEEIKGFYSMLLDQTRCTILASVKAMMKRDIKNVKEHKKAFETKSDELDAALRINSTKNNKKKEDNQEAALSALADTKTSFHHTSVDYAYEINKIQMGKRFLITEKFLALMYAYYSFFHQGYASLNDIEPYLKNLNSVMQKTQSEHTEHVTSMGDRHSAVSQLKKNKYDGLMNTPKDESVSLEGYLFKRSHNTFKTWKRRYFLIKTNQLLYQKRGKSGKDSDRVVSEDLRISHVKQTEEQDRRYCFELIMPTKRLYLQADSEKLRNVWIKSLQSGIEAAIHNTKREEPQQKKNKKSEEYGKESSSSVQRLVVDIKGLPGNEVCADCNNSEPVWASINLGVTLCIDCSGIHRKLGVHISKVRSLELDSWDPEQCSLMLKLGNSLVNALYEHSVCQPYTKPEPSESSMSKRETWIKAKYEDKQFLANRSCIKIRQHNNPINYKSSSISNTPRCNSVKVNKKGIRPLTRLFNTTKKKVRGGSDGTREIDFDDEEESDLGRAISPQYTMIGSDEPDIETETESCVPEHLLLNKPVLSSSTPDLTDISNKVLDLPQDLQLSGLDNLNNIGLHILNQKLYEAAGTGDIPGMFQALVEGADINHNEKNNGRTPLIQSVLSGSEAALQLLLSNGASLNMADHEGQSAVYHAAKLGNTLQACLLIKRGANHRTKDNDGKDALDVALDHTHADIVTMLRYDRLNEDSSHRDDNSQQLLADFSQKYSEDRGSR